MPPKKQIHNEQILETAFRMVRKNGTKVLSVRNLAKELNCSTQPIYIAFRDMSALKDALAERALNQMFGYVEKNLSENQNLLLSNILGYVQFAYEEKNLYQLMYSSNVMTMEMTSKIISQTDELSLNMMIYANGLIMMSSFGTIHYEWKQMKEMIIAAYHSFTQTRE